MTFPTERQRLREPLFPVGKEEGHYDPRAPRVRWAVRHHPTEDFVASSQIISTSVEPVITVYSERLDLLADQITGLQALVQALVGQIAGLEDLLSDRPIVSITFLSNLDSQKWKLRTQIPVTLEQYEDETVARWPETETTGTGASEMEAIANLRRDIIDLYEDLDSTDESQLSLETRNVRSVLSSALTRSE